MTTVKKRDTIYFYSHAREGRDHHAERITAQKTDYFYSHAREGRDNANAQKTPVLLISTHTPARGVTYILW